MDCGKILVNPLSSTLRPVMPREEDDTGVITLMCSAKVDGSVIAIESQGAL